MDLPLLLPFSDHSGLLFVSAQLSHRLSSSSVVRFAEKNNQLVTPFFYPFDFVNFIHLDIENDMEFGIRL